MRGKLALGNIPDEGKTDRVKYPRYGKNWQGNSLDESEISLKKRTVSALNVSPRSSPYLT
jgi:hypothetical protein